MSVTRGRLSTSNITETSSGILRKIQIKDTAVASALDATIAIDIDSQGAQTLNLNTMYKINSGVANKSGDNLSNFMDILNSATAQESMTLQLDLPYRASLDVTIANADGFCIFWEEDVF